MKTKFILLLILFNNSLFSQIAYEDDIKSGLLFRGKVLGFVVFEDWWVLNATAGVEFRFTKNFSFGVDFVHLHNIYEQEDYYDSLNPDKYREYAKKNKRNCLLIDLRFYPFQKYFSGKKIKPYFTAFGKFGGAHQYAKEEWKFIDGEVVRQNEDFFDLGLTAGAHLNFENRKGGLDFNIGYCQRFITENVEYYSETGSNRFVYNQKVSRDKLAGRVNLYFYLWKRKNITEK